jgi:rSAM/selenodomain-associated transferase 1
VRQQRLLIVFVKAPRVGTVKTRLAQQIGAEDACDAYQQLVRAVLNRIDLLHHVQLRYSPDDAASEISQWCKPPWTVSPQGAGDLGERLTRTFAESFAAGASRVIIIGSDCPWLSAADIEEAWNDLETHDLVLGPARDGGYWLVGLRGPSPELFSDISWSTETVLEQTVERARVRGLRFRLLRELRDVDTLEDWQAFSRDNSFA